MDWSECTVVESVPGRCGGKPVLRHTRITANSLFECYLLGSSAVEIADDFEITVEDVDQLIDFAVHQYIEKTRREDTLRSQPAVEASQAA